MLSAHSQISLVLKRKEVNHGLKFYAASGSSQMLRELPGGEELGQGWGRALPPAGLQLMEALLA